VYQLPLGAGRRRSLPAPPPAVPILQPLANPLVTCPCPAPAPFWPVPVARPARGRRSRLAPACRWSPRPSRSRSLLSTNYQPAPPPDRRSSGRSRLAGRQVDGQAGGNPSPGTGEAGRPRLLAGHLVRLAPATSRLATTNQPCHRHGATLAGPCCPGTARGSRGCAPSGNPASGSPKQQRSGFLPGEASLRKFLCFSSFEALPYHASLQSYLYLGKAGHQGANPGRRRTVSGRADARLPPPRTKMGHARIQNWDYHAI
jgi:hypothetical protein